jgi:hypothetical protein
MGVLRSQIETKKIFSMARVIIGLKQCQFGIDNLDNFHFDHEELAKRSDL